MTYTFNLRGENDKGFKVLSNEEADRTISHSPLK